MMKRVGVGLLVGLLGVTMTFGGARVLYRVQASEGWPEARGTVRASSVETRRSKRSATFVPRVRYDYAVGAERYTSDRLAFSNISLRDSSTAHELVGRYPVDASITVRYSPEDPQLACLECGRVGAADYAVLMVGVAITVFSGWSLVETVGHHRLSPRRPRRGGREAIPGDARLS